MIQNLGWTLGLRSLHIPDVYSFFLFASIISSILAVPCLYPHLLLFEILLMADTWRIKSYWKRGKNTIFLTVSFSGNWLIWKSIPLGLLTAGLLFSVFVSGQKKWTYSKRTSYLFLWITSKQRNNNYPFLRKFFLPLFFIWMTLSNHWPLSNNSYHWSLLLICHPGEVANFTGKFAFVGQLPVIPYCLFFSINILFCLKLCWVVTFFCVSDEDPRQLERVPCILHMDSIRGTHVDLKDRIRRYVLFT